MPRKKPNVLQVTEPETSVSSYWPDETIEAPQPQDRRTVPVAGSCRLPAEALFVLSHGIGNFRHAPWALPGQTAKSKDGRVWKTAVENGKVVLFGHAATVFIDAEARRKRDLEERLQPLIVREETLRGVLQGDMADHYRDHYQAEHAKCAEALAALQSDIAGLTGPSVDPVTGKRIGDVERHEFDPSEEIAVA